MEAVTSIVKKERYYLDTSVWGGVDDHEFKVDTARFFYMVKNKPIILLYSELVERELAFGAPKEVKDNFLSLTGYTKRVEITDEIRMLAEKYVSAGVVGKTSLEDCIHIAAATVHRADALVSWNFKHIVNVDRVKGYNAINVMLGYQALEIHSPSEVLLWNEK